MSTITVSNKRTFYLCTAESDPTELVIDISPHCRTRKCGAIKEAASTRLEPCLLLCTTTRLPLQPFDRHSVQI